MAVDSIIARPTNKVRVMVDEASGCWASELSAVATALPSASAGPIVPKPVVMPAMTMDATAMIVMLSTIFSFSCSSSCWNGFQRLGPGLPHSRGGRHVNRRQDAKNVGLHHAGEQTQHRHDNGEEKGSNAQ